MEPYRTHITFQYLPPEAEEPDDLTLGDIHTERLPSAQGPAVGDFVTLPIAHPRAPSEQVGSCQSFKVVGRNFAYSHQHIRGEGESPPREGIGPVVGSTIYVIVTDPAGDEVGLNFRERGSPSFHRSSLIHNMQ